ncbi:MAG: phosphatase PAP2 family protein [Chitinophagaceae bacterium]|nr:phosphatase PAP2 family protein [Chitinophagaceae bacterium]
MATQPLKTVQSVDDFVTKNLTGDRLIVSPAIDTVLKWTPIVSSLVFNKDRSGTGSSLMYHAKMIAASEAVMNGIIEPLKKLVPRNRPGSRLDRDSFPSGHTATAFMGAELLRRATKDKSPLIAYAGYGVAVATAAMRVYNKKHWLSDVLAGAAIGVLSVVIANAMVSRRAQQLPASN